MKRLSLANFLILVFGLILICVHTVYATPYVDTDFNNQRLQDVDLVVVREKYDDDTYQQSLYFRMYPLTNPEIYDPKALGGTIVFSPGIEIVNVFYDRYENEPANSDPEWGIPGTNYWGQSRGLEPNDSISDIISWDKNSVGFDCHFVHLDDFRVIIDYGTSFSDGAFFDINLFTGTSPLNGTAYNSGIQVGNIDRMIFGSGDFGEVTQLSVPLTSTSVPDASVILLLGSSLMGLGVFGRKNKK